MSQLRIFLAGRPTGTGSLLSKLVAGVALHRGALFRVAIHAGDHAGGDFLRENLPLMDGAMAGGAVLARADMERMAEENVVRHLVYAHPIDFVALTMNLRQLFDGRAICGDGLVADHALRRVR